jgi:hypothetical protein
MNTKKWAEEVLSKTIWVKFWDMHSGGKCKEPPYEKIYIEAESGQQAAIVFYKRFGHSPYRITCTCCGEDYAISSNPSLNEITKFHRRSSMKTIPLEEYVKQSDVLIIYNRDIQDDEKQGDIPDQGYVWVD